MSANEPQMTEEELRAAYEEEIKKIRVEHVLLENVVTLINLGMRRTGLMAGTESERDPTQVRVAADSVRALLPTVEAVSPEQAEPLRQALAQLQMAYVQITGQSVAPAAGEPSGPAGPGPAGPGPTGPGPGQSSGRLWVPGQ